MTKKSFKSDGGGGVNVSILGGPKRAAVGFKWLYTYMVITLFNNAQVKDSLF